MNPAKIALPTHYESQCIPTPLAWNAFQLPEIFQKLSVAGTYFIEIGLVFLFFAPTSHMRKLSCLHQGNAYYVGHYGLFQYHIFSFNSWLQAKFDQISMQWISNF